MMKRKYTKEHKAWRAKVLNRDDNKCVVCGKSGKYLNAHHLVPNLFKEYEYTVNNGITLCPHHHTLGRWSAHKNPLWFSNFLHIEYPILSMLANNRLLELNDEI